MGWSFKQSVVDKKQKKVGRTITGSTTATASDAGTLIRGNSGSAITIQIPNDSVGWFGDEVLSAIRLGSGEVSFTAGSGVTLRTPSGLPTSAQYGIVAAIRIGANEWVLA